MSSTYTSSAPTVVRTESIAELTSVIGAAQGVKVAGADGVNFVLVPPGYTVKTFEAFSDPAAVRQKIDVDTIDSFINYVLDYSGPSTAIFASVTSSAIALVGIIDYHANNGQAKRCGHVVEFVAKPTVEWAAVVGLHRKEIGQEEFALFLEENHKLFIQPAGSDLLELVLNLQGKSNVAFTSMRKLQNGANQLMYEEEVELKGATSMLAGTMELPTVLKLAVAPFEGEAPYEIEVRLRYKIAGRRLTFSLEMIRLHAIVRDAARIMLERVKAKLVDGEFPVPCYLGKTKSAAPAGQ